MNETMQQKIALATELTLEGCFDAHLHAREFGKKMHRVLGHTIRQFGGALFMPNLEEPITTYERAIQHKNDIERIRKAECPELPFEPIITCFLTDETDPQYLIEGFKRGFWQAGKLYLTNPDRVGGTTNAHSGVTSTRNIYRCLEIMQVPVETPTGVKKMPFLEHGEVPRQEVDEYDREKIFLDEEQYGIIDEFPELDWVLEHISTKESVDFVRNFGRNRGRATITVQHARLNRNTLFWSGLQPQYWCKPILKREKHRQAVFEAMISGEPYFGAGTDAALHWDENKYRPCGSAGVYSAHAAIEFYVEGFDYDGKLLADTERQSRLKRFLTEVMPKFYGIKPKGRTVCTKESWTVPDRYRNKDTSVTPLGFGETVQWKARRIS